jgi:hypothetical protein
VGTAPAIVGRSLSISATIGPACRYFDGRTRSAPDSAAAYGSPHAFAWNMGTTGRVLSRAETASVSDICDAIACK